MPTRLNLFFHLPGLAHLARGLQAAWMSTTWYGNPIDAQGAAVVSLAVIAPPLQQMGVAEIIDRHVPVDEQAEFGHGDILSLGPVQLRCPPLGRSPHPHPFPRKAGGEGTREVI